MKIHNMLTYDQLGDTESTEARAGSMSFCRFLKLLVGFLWFSALCPTSPVFLKVCVAVACFCQQKPSLCFVRSGFDCRMHVWRLLSVRFVESALNILVNWTPRPASDLRAIPEHCIISPFSAVHLHSRTLGVYTSALARKPIKSAPGGPDSSPPDPGKPSFSLGGADDFSPGLEGRVGDQF